VRASYVARVIDEQNGIALSTSHQDAAIDPSQKLSDGLPAHCRPSLATMPRSAQAEDPHLGLNELPT